MKADMSSKPDKEERGRKLSEKGMSYKSDRYSGIVSALKQTAMHIRKMMAENETLEKIRKRYAGWLTDYEHFLALYDELLANVNESEKEALESEHSDYDIFLTNFKKEVENYFSFQQVKPEPTERGTKKSNRGSQRTKSRLSTVGDISSKLLKEEQTKAELEARKIALDRKRDIEIAKLQLRFQEEELELDTNIAVSSAKSKVLQQFERYENDFSESDEENPKEHIPMPTPRTTLFTEVASLSTIEELGLNPHAKSFVPDLRQKRDFTVKVEKTDSHIQKPEVPNEKTESQVKRSDTVPKDTESAAIQSVVQYLRRPIPEIKKFGGNPLEFRRFLRQFHAKVVLNTHDDDERMNYLEQLTYGEANRCVAGFSHLSGDRAYKAAMKQLEERYGDNEVIATAFIKKALDWPAVKDAKSLDEFALFLVECLNAAESMGSNSVLDYPDNIKRLMQKLPIYMHDRWRNVVLKTKEAKKRVHFSDFVTFAKTEAKKSNDPTYGSASVTSSTNRNIEKRGQAGKITAPVNIANEGSESAKQETVEQKCVYCDGSGHFISDCKGFLRISLQDRYNFLRNKGLCYGCLKKGHLTKKCRGRHKCSICGRRHPTALHDPTRVPVTASAETGDSHPTDTKSDATLSHNPDVTATTDMRAGETTCAMAIIPVRVKLKDRNHSVATYAFFDSGSSVSFCTDSLMRQLGASGKKRDITLSTMGEDYKLSSHILKGLQVTDLDMNELVDLPQVYTKDRMPVDKGHIPTRGEIHDWPHLSHIDIPDIDVEVGLLLGSNVPDAYAPQEVITGPSGSPHATRTRLGWIIWNVLRSSREDMQSYTVNRAAVENHIEMDMRLEQLVKDSINLEFPERASDDIRQNSVEDNMFLKQVEESICHQDNGHYSIKLPFRDPSVRLPNNVQQGVQRLGSLKRKFQKSERFKTDYVNFMNKLFDKGYAEIIPKDHIDRNDGRVWYLPHHGVYPVKKPDKIRVVFDCSATYEGISLNSQLLQGPDLTNSLLGVLLRFRQESIAIQGDIEAMFHQVEVPESDRDCLRFLWWRDGNLDKEPEHCRMKVHLFGATSSPSCCNFALQQTVKDHKELFSQEVTNAVARNMYVDDCLLSVNSEHKAESIIEDLSMLCKKGGFHLEKFVSNSKEVLNSIPEAERAGDVKQWNLNGGTLTERALGVYWFVDEDVIGFKISLKQQPVTRRGILSTVSSIYDPLGIVSPFVMTAKILLQQLCKSGIKWDDKITGKLEKVWTAWFSQAKELESVKIPRCYKPRDMDRIVSCQLHVFADASEVGMGVVIYMRLTDDNSRIHCSFVLGKARVTPLKAVTIPRLELTACTMAVKLSKVIADQLEYSIDAIHFWTDSMSVLRYIANTKTRFKTFVANRLVVIHDATTVNQWHYVRSEDNPADCASRGIPTVSKFLDYTPWLDGPEFLWKPESTWIQPVDPGNLNLEDDKEVKSNLAMSMTLTLSSPKGLERLIEYHSDWKRLKASVGWFLKAKDNLKSRTSKGEENRKERSKNVSTNMCLTPNILERAERSLVMFVQRLHFPKELEDINTKGVKKSSPLCKLDPFIHDRILRVGGRLSNSEISFDAKHPIIIPKESKVARLLVEDAHKSSGHMGKNATLSILRERFWIVGANSYLKSIISKCTICKRYQSPRMTQKMANLPSERLEPDEPPFTRVGMDYFGPFELKRGRSSVKRYGVIFTCLNSRALHLEVAFSLDTDSCIDAIRRFIARRGKPKFMRSDNGTNLIGAEREMRESIQEWNTDHIQGHMRQLGIEWAFNPPAASHFGGVWERLIRSVRKVLYSVLHEQTNRLDDEGLITLFCEVEAILNGRPLTSVTDDPNDMRALTPNHLLLLRPGEHFPPGVFVKTDNYVRRRWRQIQYLANIFWTRWIKEYMPLLQTRQKWLQPKDNPKVGDIVLIVDNGPRNSWNLGRIIEILNKKDDVVRVVKVKTGSSVLTRPITKLCLVLESEIN